MWFAKKKKNSLECDVLGLNGKRKQWETAETAKTALNLFKDKIFSTSTSKAVI